MPEFPSGYDALSGDGLTGSEELLIDSTGTKYITIDELRKKFNDVASVDYSGATTLALTHRGKRLRSTGASDHNVTVPPNASVAFPVGTVILFRVHGTGLPTLVAGSGVTLNGASLVMTDQYQEAYITKVATNEWDVTIGGSGGGADVTAPVLLTATVEDANPDEIVLTYDEALNSAIVPAVGDYTPSGGKTVTNVAIVGAVVTLTVNSAYANGDVITLTYDGAGSGTPLQDAAGNEAADLTAQAVDNNISSSSIIATLLAAGAFHSYIDPAQDVTTTTSGSDELIDEILDQASVDTSFKIVQAGAARPKLVTGINGLPCVEVDGSTYITNPTVWTTPLAKPFHRIAVVEFKAVIGASQYLIYKLGSQQADFGIFSDNKGFAYSGNLLFTGSTIVVDTPYVVCLEFANDGANDKIFINGVLEATGNAGTQGPLQGISLGADSAGADGWIGDHIVTDGLLSNSDRDAVIAELMTKYGI